MANVTYIKGVRTRFRNTLARELDKARHILCGDSHKYDKSEIVKSAQLCSKLLKSYCGKLEEKSKELADTVGDSDKDFTQQVIDDDCQLVLDSEQAYLELEQFIELSDKDIDSKHVMSEQIQTDRLLRVQEQMQRFMVTQMDQQQEFFLRHESERKQPNTVKLPQLELCFFNGDKLRWTTFWDAFECTVHKNKRLSKVEKFSYLISKLKDDAKRAVDGLALSNDNYDIAIGILHERFGNRQEVIDLHYKKLLNISSPSNKVQSLRAFVDIVERNLRSLKVLDENISQHVFVSLIRSKLPEDVLRHLEFTKGSKTEWTIKSLRDQLQEYVCACEKAEGAKMDQISKPKQQNQVSSNTTSPLTSTSAESLLANTSISSNNKKKSSYANLCRYCQNQHWSDECLTYQTIEDRKRRIKGSCFKCLKEGHLASDCKTNKQCVHCSEYNVHHRSLCPKKFKKKPTIETSSVSLSETNPKSTGCDVLKENVMVSSGEMVLMQTATTEITNVKDTKSTSVRLLLDCGSQRTYISQRLANKLGLKKEKEENIILTTFGSRNTKSIKTASTTFSLKLKDGSTMDVSANIVPVISGNIHRRRFNVSSINNLDQLINSVGLADSIPTDNEYSSVDLLIGNDFYLDIVLSQRIELQPGLYLLASKLGWILTGRTHDCDENKHDTSMLVLTFGNNVTKEGVFQSVGSCVSQKPDLEDFWNTEAIGIVDKQTTSADEEAMDHFKDTLKFEDGRYQVTWPWKREHVELPKNKALAYGRLKSCIQKMKSRPEILKKYNAVIQDQLLKGVIEPVDDSMKDGLIHYIPHHAVVTPLKTTTKLRVVYDASAKTKQENKSLNECLLRGPVMLHDLCGLLLRFRLYPIALVADIEKAFLQIGLQKSERDVTRFLWLKSCMNPSTDQNNVQEYRFCRVPFGVISSPFLLGATVDAHLESYENEIAEKIKNDIYVDNVITGTDTETEALNMYERAKTMFNEASMNLREWVSNSDMVKLLIPENDQANSEVCSVLGHVWNHHSDTLSIKPAKLDAHQADLTKRAMLKIIASVFDPLGLFNPVLLRGKLLLQLLWSKNLDWDDIVEDDTIKETWSSIHSDIQKISEYKIQRCISKRNDKQTTYNLLCFCDASATSYAAAVYLHNTTNGKITTDLIFAKSRVAPVKTMTIPRLELMAVLIGVRCIKFVQEQIQVRIGNVYLWTDSMCVLGWLRSEKTLPVFVRNRVQEIKQHGHIHISYVNTKENPADIATRGTTLDDIYKDSMWWHGPSWLKDPIEHWFSRYNQDLDVQPETKQENVIDNTNVFSVFDNKKIETVRTPFDIDYTKYSSVTKLLRVTSLAHRFVKQSRKQVYTKGPITASELQNSERMWISVIQRRHYTDIVDGLDKNKSTNLQRQLGLFLDKDGIIRCKGRLEHSDLSEAARQPILLPKNDKLTLLIIEKIHKECLHSGISQTLAHVRFRFWIPQGRTVVRLVLRSCSVCRRHQGGPYKMPPLAPLPISRVRESQPFTRIGLDYLGPLYIKTSEETKKMWICLFTCMVTRAIHLELIPDMTTEQFLLAFKRFVSQRGTPVEILSDNASQFKVAGEFLRQVFKTVSSEDVQSYCSNSGVSWKFIVEVAPWMGGFYERLVGLVKRALRKSLGRKMLTLIQLQTVVKEVEAIVNSRPLVYLDDDINSTITLTPSHFLTLNPHTGIHSNELESSDTDFDPYESSSDRLLTIWKKGQKLLSEFWRIWRFEYLASLRERMQSSLKSGRIQSDFTPHVNDVVLIKDSLPRGSWKIGRVTQLIISKDGNVRSAKLRLPSGKILGRPLNLLYPIECAGSEIKSEVKGSGCVTPPVCSTNDTLTPSDISTNTFRPMRAAAQTAQCRIKQQMKL